MPKNIELALVGRETSGPKELLKCYPRILERLDMLWGDTVNFDKYVADLVFNDRNDERQGFEPEVLQDIFFIKELHEAMHLPGSKAKPGPPAGSSAWAWDAGRSREQEAKPGAKQKEARAKQTSAASIDPEDVHWPMERDLLRVKAKMEMRRMGRQSGMFKKLGEILLEASAIDKAKLEVALRSQASGGRKSLLGAILVSAGFAKDADVQRALWLQKGGQLLDLDRLAMDPAAAGALSRDVEVSKKIVAVAKSGPAVLVAVSNPADFKEIDWLSFALGSSVELAWASSAAIERRLSGVGQKRPGAKQEAAEQFTEIAKAAAKPIAERKARQEAVFDLTKRGSSGVEDATVADMVRKMMSDAKSFGASDIHIEAGQKSALASVRMRVDGELSHYAHYDKAAHEAVVSRIKIASDMDISERRRPQDGKLAAIGADGARIEARVSSIPSVGGFEAITLRLISAAEPVDLARVGLDSDQLAKVEGLLASPHGLILVCGPTGSGKTTTLHSMLARINTPGKKIWTVEDPVEIVQEGLVQTQAQPKINYGFDAAVRAFMRADPDVIMIGEVRDAATAAAALEASLTGHLVLTTLHTNSAAETAVRLLDLGADPFALADSLRGIVAQRLGRRLCATCAATRRLSPGELDEVAREYFIAMGIPNSSRTERARWLSEMSNKQTGNIEIKEPVGCSVCRDTGYRGRVGVVEVLVASEQVKRALASKASAADLLKIARAEGFKPLKARAIELACEGCITLSEARSLAM